MSNRGTRVNELVKREISDILHTRYQGDAVNITITEVAVSSDLRSARVYYSILGDEGTSYLAEKFFAARHREIRQEMSKRIVLKYLPRLRFIEDDSIARGTEVLKIIDEIDAEEDQD
ncbi:30S ribosome-binding factor RbfA [Ruficoccus sp. ZRK36]|uniref:30S ribosome-binding factor RbfA n=1 Tax=Ruficoccus sp. ZRK36 TaxID=2866311 RepID=UPI001C72D193|nr:30S ribosome-binding factor RbfA [Ruficoccus sp. ZRK36]QYY35342.1 30S ribosome-binding factor RbfA [Ruficoccus sp. ZRK36]